VGLQVCDVAFVPMAVINNSTSFIAEEDEQVEFYDLAERFVVHKLRTDSMGKGMIIY
jgi:hypothetical protein